MHLSPPLLQDEKTGMHIGQQDDGHEQASRWLGDSDVTFCQETAMAFEQFRAGIKVITILRMNLHANS
jgi:hypothetical protein